MKWTAATSAGSRRVSFRGEAPGNVGTVFRGTISAEMQRAFRSMTVPSMRRGVRPGWRVEMPTPYLSYPNTEGARRFMVFHSPTTRTPLVLRFDRVVSESLLGDITQAFTKNKEVQHDQAEVGQRAEAGQAVGPLPGTPIQPEQGRDRRDRPPAQDAGHQAQGKQVAGTWWKKSKKKKAAR
jgi:hypothetical protein